MPYNGTPFDALMATPSPTLEQIQQTLYFIQTPEAGTVFLILQHLIR